MYEPKDTKFKIGNQAAKWKRSRLTCAQSERPMEFDSLSEATHIHKRQKVDHESDQEVWHDINADTYGGMIWDVDGG